MSKQLAILDYLGNVDRFSTLFTRVNELVAALNVEIITANNNANGALTSGNGFVNGIFGSSTLVATTIRGGNVQSTANLVLASNLTFQGAKLDFGNTTAVINIGSLQIGATNTILPSRLSVGNSSVNVVINSTSISLGGTSYSNLTPNIVVANNGTTIGTRRKLNFKPSNSITLLLEDDEANDAINVTMLNSETPSAYGSNTYVQFNDDGVFGGTSGFTFSKTTNTVTVANNIIVEKIDLSKGGRLTSFSNTFNVNTAYTFDSFPKTDFRAVDYTISIVDNAANNLQAMKLMVFHDGTNVYQTEYASMFSNTEIATIGVSSNSTHVFIQCTSSSANTTVKGARTAVAV